MNKKRNDAIGIVITVVILILLVFLSNLKIEKISYIENAFSKIIMPIQSGFTFLKNKLQGDDEYFANLDILKEENKKLKEKNSNLEGELRRLEMIESENKTMKEYLNLSEQYKQYETVPAYIINKDTSNYSKIFVINIGSKNGIKKDMTVLAAEGLVGHVISVTETTAKIQTLIDSSNIVSATLENSTDTVICRGMLENSELKASYVATDTTLSQGEKLYTSGMGGIYPKGIYIGTIKQIIETKNITDRSFIVETAVDFNNLETVLVIKN